ncbi:MAG: MMPL family transporter [Lachnospiraceae bacterium]|nr:MMPL family transporter [Lachnospiraceae bacterium]
MSTDLLPNMNMPYAIVLTSYVGASPEQVEKNVTESIEGAMATTSNIKNVSSVSAENYSLVVLEFEQTANMDSITIEMRESLDQIKGTWPDQVGNPIIMKINPDMMPIMITALDVKGMDKLELSDYTEKEIVPELKSVEGVASVTSVGAAEESVQVILNQEKIDALNKQITDSLDQKFADAQGAMNSAKGQLESGKRQLENGKNEMTGQLSEAQNELNNRRLEMFQTESDLNQKLTEAKEAKTTLEDSLKEMEKSGESLKTLQSGYASLSMLLQLKDSVDDATFQAQSGMTKEEFQTNYDTVKTSYDAIKISLGLESDASDKEVNEKYAQTIAELQKNLTSLNASIQMLETALANINEGKNSINEALATLNASEVAGIIEMAEASAGIASGEAQLEQKQEEFKKTKETAYDEADLDNILTMDTLTGILTAQNFSMPAGYITESGEKYLVRVGDTVDSVEDLKELVLMDLGMDGVGPIHLSEVADITVVDNTSESYAKVNGNPGIMLTVEKQTGYSTGDVTKRVYDRIDELEKENKNLYIAVLMDQGVYIGMIVDSVFNNMIFGALLAIIILVIFLKDVRPTLVIACSIPVSVVFAVVLMYFSGVTLNMISLSGLALGIGMLVDNSIVVIENIYRMRNEGVSAKEAAVRGTRQVTGAIVASTLTTVSVFVPIVFTEGITRQLFVDMGLTIAYALLASLLIALTFVPMMASSTLSRTKEIRYPWLEFIQEKYGMFLDKLLRRKILVLLVMILLLAGSVQAALSRGTAFMPQMESTQMSVAVKPDKGTNFEEACEIADQVTEKIRTIEDVETVGAMAGGGDSVMSVMGGSDSNEVSLYLILKEDKKLSNEKIASKIRKLTKDMNATITVSESEMDMSMLGEGLSIEIKGRNTDKLQKIASDVAKIVEKVDGTKDVSDGMEETTPELRIRVDKEKAAKYGMTVAQVYQLVQEKMEDETSDTTISTDLKDYDVFLVGAQAADVTLDRIKNMTFIYTNRENNEKEEISINEIADLEERDGLSSISRDNQERCLTVTAQMKDGYNIGIVGNKVEEAIKDYKLPNGYSLEMKGEDEMITEAMEQMVLMLLLGVAFIYLVMVAQFQSLRAPFIILFTIPLALTGGFAALFISGNEVSVIAMIGFVMLVGVIVNNGIVMVDYINQLRREGREKQEAIIEAGKTRMRPIFMTALTTILAMTTMAFGRDMGSDMSRPMAIVTIGGMIYGTLMTLVVVPCIYDIFYGNKSMVEEDE